MDLLLTHGYFLAEDAKERQIMKPYAPLGILYLSSYLRARGFDVEIYDSTFGSREELFRILETEPPATLGIYANLMTRPSAIGILRHARAMRMESDCGWARAGELSHSVSRRRREHRSVGRGRTGLGSDSSRPTARADTRTVVHGRRRTR